MTTPTAQFEDINVLETKIQSSTIPQALRERTQFQIDRLTRLTSSQNYSQEYDSVARHLDWIVSLPWEKRSEDNLSLQVAQERLDKNHHGLEHIKERILEYISVENLKKQNQQKPSRAPSLLLLGLVGTGKTTMAYSIAEALGRQFGRIPMGGMGDALQLRGRSHVYPDAEPGQIMKVLRRVQVKNPVILLDEIDRIAEDARSDIMGVLVELLDPEQSSNFLDHYIDYPFDLSEILFITTANNTTNVATAVLDRLEIVEMPTYSDQQKIVIGKSYILPRETTAAGLAKDELVFDETVWSVIARPLGFDAGMRTLERTIGSICRKVAKLKVEGKITKVIITQDNLNQFLSTW